MSKLHLLAPFMCKYEFQKMYSIGAHNNCTLCSEISKKKYFDVFHIN